MYIIHRNREGHPVGHPEFAQATSGCRWCTPPAMFRHAPLSDAGRLASHECTRDNFPRTRANPGMGGAGTRSEGTRMKMYVAGLISPR